MKQEDQHHTRFSVALPSLALTHSLDSYDMLILSNNDILVGDGVVAGMQDMLRHYPFMAPSTTLHGAGHNPPQSLAIQCGLDAGIEAQVNEASNYQRTQNLLGHMCGSGKAYEFPAGRLKFGVSRWTRASEYWMVQ